MKKIIRVATIAGSLGILLKGQLRFMSSHYDIIGVASEEDLIKVGMDEGIRTIPVKMSRSITPFRDLISLYKLYNVFRKEKPFVVHTHTPKAGTLGMMAAKLARVPHRLHTIAGLPLLETKGLKRMILNTVETITYSCATLVLPNSFALQEIVLQEGFCKNEKLKVIGNGSSNGIDTDYYDRKNVPSEQIEELKQKFNINPGDIVFIYIGRVVTDKGVNELVKAFDSISKTHSDVRLIIVGPTEKLLDPIDTKTESIIKNNTFIYETGMVDDIRPYVAVSDIFTFPSYREGFPNVVLQASCMETPCIVTDINGCNEIITHNFNGLIIPKKDSTALKNAMLELYDNHEKVRDLKNNSRSNIIGHYKREDIWKELLNLYNNLD
ncbi:MAG: glycosyltransferase family 4 protein [Aquaticitalea sp.]